LSKGNICTFKVLGITELKQIMAPVWKTLCCCFRRNCLHFNTARNFHCNEFL